MFWFLFGLGGLILVGTFWDKLREWFLGLVEEIQQDLPKTAQLLKKGIIEIDKVVVRGRRVVKRAIVFFKEKAKVVRRVTEEEIDRDDLPDEIREQLDEEGRVQVEVAQVEN